MFPRAIRARTAPAVILLAALAARGGNAQVPPEPPPECPVSFHLESPDTLGAVGAQSSIVTDSEGRAHIAYRNSSGIQIRYARQEGQQWVIDLVPQPGTAHGLSLALDPAGDPYIGYGVQEETPIGVVTSATVAWLNGGRWTTERIENAFPTEASIAFDPAGVLHAVYFSYVPAFVIRYATRTPDGWAIETAFPTGGFGAGRFSLAFDSQGRPHVTAQVLEIPLHMVRTETGWIVDRQPAGVGASLALDAADVPHVATHVRVPPSVQYRTRANGVWKIETVDSVDVGPAPAVSLAIDRFGRPVLSYYDRPAHTLKLAWKDSGIWRARVVDAGGSGESPSLSLAGGADPRISYTDSSSFDLRFAAVGIPPPNQGPTANAGGPYAGTVGQPIPFYAARSSDPDGDALVYAWDFGDGIRGAGVAPEHMYAAAGAYRVCLAVTDNGCPSREDSACLTATVREALDARVFRNKANRIELSGNGERHCFQLEPVDHDFRLSDLDPSSLVAAFGAARVSPVLGKPFLVTDSDDNGIPEIEICFTPTALSALFTSAPSGKSQVTMTLEGALRSGARIRGEVAIEIKKHHDCRDGCAEVSPNPLNPDARITFTTWRPGSVEIDMFDSQGRRLGAILGRTFLAAGTHEQRIDGRDSRGRALPSGVYFYRIRTPEGDRTGRFSILK